MLGTVRLKANRVAQAKARMCCEIEEELLRLMLQNSALARRLAGLGRTRSKGP